MSAAVKPLAEAPLKPNADVVEALENLLAEARKGELIGMVMFGRYVGGNYSCSGQSGQNDFPAVLAAFEDWKFRRAWERNRTDGV